ncbi:MAG: VCBS domain-containing protein [Pirellulaceae bacterium]
MGSNERNGRQQSRCERQRRQYRVQFRDRICKYRGDQRQRRTDYQQRICLYFTGTDENTTSLTQTVDSILTAASWSDVDNSAVKGIAVTALSANGAWEYSTDGITWTAFGSVATNSALLLNSTSLIRFVPDSANGETATFDFVAWDQTSGSASANGSPQYGDATTSGGTTAYSAETASAQIVVTDVNDTITATSDSATAVEAGGVANGTAGTDPTGNVLTNDSDVDNADTMTIVGVASGIQGSTSGNVGAGVNGNYGTLTIQSDGSYAYVVDNSNATVQGLRTSGDTIVDTFSYTVQDSQGASSTTQITVTIQGTNDDPVAVVDAANAIEASGVANGTAGTDPSGNVLTNDTDVDSGDTKTVIGVVTGVAGSASGNVGSALVGTYGTVTLNSDGSYSYVVDNSNAAVQALLTYSDTLTDTFTYTMTDIAGATSTTQLTVTIHGGNEAPDAIDDAATATEAGGDANGTAGTNPSGNVLTNDTDLDSGDTKTVVGVVVGSQSSATGNVGSALAGSYGTITLNSDGSYSYVVDNNNAAVQALRTTANTLTETFTYTMQDTAGLQSTAEVTITIQGTNDNPVAVANTATAIEDGGILNSTSGYDPTGNVLTNDSDVDAGETLTVTGVALGVQSSASGNVGSSVAGSYGSIVINSDGSYTYTVDNNNAAVEALNNGDTLTETFTYTVTDLAGGTSTTQIIITIDGRDDLPYAYQDFATAVEAGGVANGTAGTNPTGNVLANDAAPNGEFIIGVLAGNQPSASGNVGVGVVGLYGTVTIDINGDFVYILDNSNPAVEALRTSGDHLVDEFTYTMEDSLGYQSTTQLTITIDGTNDNPVVTIDSGTAVESGGVNNATAGSDATGSVFTNDSDVDASDTLDVFGVAAGVQASATGSVAAAVTGSYGAIVIQSDGTYVYSVDENNAAVQALRTAADTLSDTFTYTAIDAAGATSTTQITITIHGANDDPNAIADTANATEAGGVANGTAGTNPSGNVLTNDTDIDSVANGETKTVDGVLAGIQSSASGNVGSAVAGSYGSITINSDGSYSYVVDNSNAAVQALRTSGQTLTDTFTYTMIDTAGAQSTTQITVTIHGANDNPTAVADSATAVEAGGVANGTAGTNPSGNVLTNDGDVDAGDTLSVTGVAAGVQASASGNVGSSVAGSYGSIQIAAGGAYTYIVDNSNAAVQALRTSGETLTETFTYTSIDTAGATATTQITITIQGANDAPVALGDAIIAVEAGGTANGTAGTDPTGNLLTNDTDVDAGDTKTVVGVDAGVVSFPTGNVGLSVRTTYGWINVDAAGNYTYTVDNTDAAVQALRTSTQTLTDTFSYTVQDTAGLQATAQGTVTIQGAGDAPVAVIDTATASEAGIQQWNRWIERFRQRADQ